MATYVPTGPGTRDENEDLGQYVTRIDPADTPFYSNAGSVTSTAIKHEWEVVELTAPNNDNFQAFGADSSDTDGIPPYRIDNAVSESTKDGKTADIYDGISTNAAANASEAQKIWKGLELRRDMEAIMTRNAAKVATGTYKLGGVQTYITNGSYGATTGAPPTGDGSDTATAGVSRALDTIAYVNEGMLEAYQDGGRPRIMYMAPDLRQAFSTIPDANAGGTSATNMVSQTNSAPMTFVGTTANYLSDFGQLEVATSIHMAGGVILGMDPDHYAKAPVPGGEFADSDLAKVGTSERFVIAWRGTLEVNAPKAHFQVRDLTAS